jgi:hypothetical protein
MERRAVATGRQEATSMTIGLIEAVGRWGEVLGLDPELLPAPDALRSAFDSASPACRPPASMRAIEAWERRHGFRLPRGLRAWLHISDGFYGHRGPLIHPLAAIGPMVPFARIPGMVVQPESWFELGNPNMETVCIDLAYPWPGGDCPLFTSGDDFSQSAPRLIADGFDTWFLRVLNAGGREYWFEDGFRTLGHPWVEHRRNTPVPALPDRLRPLANRVRSHMEPGADDRAIASAFGLSMMDVEMIFRHYQHCLAERLPIRTD